MKLVKVFFDEGNFSSTADFDIHHAQLKGTGLVVAKPSVTGVSRHYCTFRIVEFEF